MLTKILYEDNEIIVCEKRAGVPVQTSKIGSMDMVSELKNYLHRKNENNEIYVVHRLDQPVEGIIVFARTKGASASLTNQVGLASDEDKMLKIYNARVYGHMSSKKGMLKDIMIMDGKLNRSFIVTDEKDNEYTIKESEIKDPSKQASKYKPKEARLEYEVLSSDEETDLLKIHLLTGRHHQIRLQLAFAGFPLVGDQKYGTNASMQYSKDKGIRNVSLKAVQLEFKHPVSGKQMTFHTGA